ncbi:MULTISPECIES: hypothetical protein [unclassified Psychrobacillus]|uniref:hypothetical protein n=1 Tax=unclassified Psychrobacillus TaxID=2636677 RepID=UPI0030F89F14
MNKPKWIKSKILGHVFVLIILLRGLMIGIELAFDSNDVENGVILIIMMVIVMMIEIYRMEKAIKKGKHTHPSD